MKLLEHDVCVVDDDPAITDSLQMLLETAGCNVTAYSSGVQFLQSDIRTFHGCVAAPFYAAPAMRPARAPGKIALGSDTIEPASGGLQQLRCTCGRTCAHVRVLA